jgi:nitroimidazol reductase NimA-like FMN-containing flavoprotein (pyridoxamine 5'-phosphate oxidase superfamily)
MMIHEMTVEECRTLLGRASMGRLGCSLDNQAYVVPVYLAYEPNYIYVFSTLGQKFSECAPILRFVYKLTKSGRSLSG